MRLWRRSAGRAADPCVADLVAALGADAVRADGAARHLASTDASIFRGGAAGPVCFPTTTEDVQKIVRVAAAHDRPVMARGAGSGLTGGAAPLGEPVVVATTRMNRLLDVDVEDRVAWVQPGVINLDLSNQLAAHGLHFAPDPSSQQVCTIGGNVANNSGGPHCLAYGVTSAHVLAVEVVVSSGDVVLLGGLDGEPDGYDLRGAFIGSEGMLGIATKVAVRLTPNPPSVRTMLLSFDQVGDAAATVGAIIAAGLVPAAIEMMDRRCVAAVEDFVHAGYPREAAAVLLVEVDGQPRGVDVQARTVIEIGERHGAEIRIAADEAERALLWKGRKSAFGAIARIAPDYYLHDTVVPRTRLVEVLEAVYEIVDRHDLVVLNVFHAGDGNLHPLLAYDAREPGVRERVEAAGKEIIEVSLAVGGVLSGEHGIGVEKRDFMQLQFSAADLDHQALLRPGLRSPLPVQPREGAALGALVFRHRGTLGIERRRGVGMSGVSRAEIDDEALHSFAAEVGPDGAVVVRGGGTQWEVGGSPSADAREVRPPVGIVELRPDEMTAHVRAGTPVEELHTALAEVGQRTALPDTTGSTVGGAVAVGRSGVARLGRGHVRDAVLQVRYVASDGRLVTAGGPTVKNVSGFDLCRLMVGSLGTIGCLGDVILRTQPVPEVERWHRLDGVDPHHVADRAPTAASVLWDGASTWVQLSGYEVDVADDLAELGHPEAQDPPSLPPHRWSRRPRELRGLSPETGGFVAEVGVGVVHGERPDPEPEPMPAPIIELNRRVRDLFDPERRFNPGRSVGRV